MPLYHTVQGSVNYTVVGTPTIVDGVVSGFSADDYLSLTQSFSSAVSSLEIIIKCKWDDSGKNCFLSLFDLDVNKYGSNGNFELLFRNHDGSWQAIRGAGADVSFDTWYWLSIKYENGTMYLSYSDDGANYILIGKQDVASWSPIFSNCSIGYNNANTGNTIDLNNTYIKINGQPWFGVCPVEVKHIDYGTSVGYTKVGSPTISNGVASNFSGSDYLQLSQTVPSGTAKTFEISTKFTTPDSFDNTGSIIAIQNYYSYGIRVIRENSSTATLYGTSHSNGAYYSVNGTTGSISPSTTYYVKYKVDGENGTQTLSISTDNENWQHFNGEYTVGYYNDNAILWRIGYSAYGASECSIDLNETYIKVNGKLWFYRPATNYLVKDDKLVFADQGLYLTGPVDYTVVGSPTIVDGVVSGFSDNNYLYLSSAPQFTSSVCFSCKFTTGSTLPTATFTPLFIGRSYYNGIGIYKDGVNHRLHCRILPDVGSSIGNYITNIALSVDTTYISELSWDGTNYTLNLYSENKTLLGTASITAGKFSNNYYAPMISYDMQNVFNGSIDLNETYIKVNDQLWFYGKNYATQNIAPVPAGYTYGTTTTPSIGYVDMRTQVFTPAPSGATIGRDE